MNLKNKTPESVFRGRPAALILGSGEDFPLEVPSLQWEKTMIICADGGANLAQKWSLKPTIIVGDGDSITADTRQYWLKENIPFLKFPKEKDQTDLDLAVKYALKLGAKEIMMVGAWGSRIDHSLGNLELLFWLAKRGIRNTLLSNTYHISACTKRFWTSVEVGSTVSLLPLTPRVENIFSYGLRYQLSGNTIARGRTLTISNVAMNERIGLRFNTGVLLVVIKNTPRI